MKPYLRFQCTAGAVLAILMAVAGCDRLDMYDQPRLTPYQLTHVFPDQSSARPPIPGAIARGQLREDNALYMGKQDDSYVNEIPIAAYRALYDRKPTSFEASFEEVPQSVLRSRLLERGRERFNIYCSVCHGRVGDGDGMIVRRGFRRPPSYHIDRLRQSANGYFYEVIQNGIGAMAGYSAQIEVADRWAIVGYIRALQLSQNAQPGDVPDDRQTDLNHEPPARSQ